MNKLFYPKLAVSNIAKNRRTYIPYILTATLTVTVFYLISSLSRNQGLNRLAGGDSIAALMSMGCWVVGIFALVFLFYTNSFLMKRRKKEFGLFNILGMEKKHLSRVIAYETLYMAIISLTVGILLGILLDKAMYLLIVRFLGADVPLGFYISLPSILTAVILFSCIFFLIFLNSMRQVHLTKPIELLQGGNVGEKEPRAKWFLAVLGLCCLVGGYTIAVVSENPVAAILNFFFAVILVIAGTYLCFTAGSVALLKLLRKNKRYYYKPTHFTSVSGMIYRMKQNAVGLANICILSTMVLVMLASTTSMMIGVEDIIRSRYPYDIVVYAFEAQPDRNEAIRSCADQLLREKGVDKEAEIAYTYLSFAAALDGTSFRTENNDTLSALNNTYNLIFIPLEDYNRVMGRDASLREGQVLLYSNRDGYKGDSLSVFDRKYEIKERLDDFVANGVIASNIASSHFIVVRDMDEINHLYEMQKQAFGDKASDIRFMYGFDMNCEEDIQTEVYRGLKDGLNEQEIRFTMDCKANSRTSFMSVYGGLFFIGIFLGALFVMATILIIYYKQISEGYDDKERFNIMQKVGMSHSEVKRSIHSQILTVFFLPLVTAGVHIVFAFPIISRILATLHLTDTGLYILCTVCCFLAFSLFYGLIYAVTAKAYYRIVSR